MHLWYSLWETGDFLFFPVFVLPNFFLFLGGILFFSLEVREFLSPFPIPSSAGNNGVVLPPSPGYSVFSSLYATRFWCLAMASTLPSPPPSSFIPPPSHTPDQSVNPPPCCRPWVRFEFQLRCQLSDQGSSPRPHVPQNVTLALITSLEERREGNASTKKRGTEKYIRS